MNCEVYGHCDLYEKVPLTMKSKLTANILDLRKINI